MDDKQIFDIAIAGGGMVGMSLAVALGRQNLRVAVIEKERMEAQLEPAFDGRVSAVALGSRHLLQNIGVWEGMAKEAQPIWDIRVSDGHTPVFLHYDHHEIGGEPFGYIVENRYIRHALHGAARAMENITLIENAAVEKFETDDTSVTVHLGTQHSALATRLLIGADGKQSKIRRLAGIKAVEWNYRQTAIVCTIAHEKPHDGLAQERFLPAGPFAALPMISSPHRGEVRRGASTVQLQTPNRESPHPDPPPTGEGMRSSLVWVEPNDRVRTYLELSDDELAQEITERVGNYLGKITVAGKRFSYPLSLMHARTYIGKRLALAGDAAHAIHPIAGQGVNLGFRDAAVLAELLGDAHRSGHDIGSPDILEHYQRWRRFDNTAMLAVTDGLNRLFSTNITPIKLARDFGLWAVGKMPPVKRFFMRSAMGLSGDVPKWMKKA